MAPSSNLVTAEPTDQVFPDRQVLYPKTRKILINPNVALSNSSVVMVSLHFYLQKHIPCSCKVAYPQNHPLKHRKQSWVNKNGFRLFAK